MLRKIDGFPPDLSPLGYHPRQDQKCGGGADIWLTEANVVCWCHSAKFQEVAVRICLGWGWHCDSDDGVVLKMPSEIEINWIYLSRGNGQKPWGRVGFQIFETTMTTPCLVPFADNFLCFFRRGFNRPAGPFFEMDGHVNSRSTALP